MFIIRCMSMFGSGVTHGDHLENPTTPLGALDYISILKYSDMSLLLIFKFNAKLYCCSKQANNRVDRFQV